MPTKKKGTRKSRKSSKSPPRKSSKKGGTNKNKDASESELWVINPESGRMVQKGKPTYERLKASGQLKKLQHYRIPKSKVPWEQAKPKGKKREEMYKAHPEMFALEPKSEFEKRGERPLNQDERPKYPVASADRPDKVSCYGIKSEMRRLHMDRRSIADPKRMAYIQARFIELLNENCLA